MKIPESASQKLFQILSSNNRNSSVGDIFAGRILSIKGGLLLMQLSDGTEINAQVNFNVKYNAGDILKLEVIDQQQGSLIVREIEQYSVLDTSSSKNENNPLTLLKSMNLAANETRIEVTKAIFQMGVKPSAQLVEKASMLIEQKPAINPKLAVFLTLNGMGDKQPYFALLNEMDNGTFHFVEKLQNLLTQIQNTDEKTVSVIAEKFLADDNTKNLTSATEKIYNICQSDSISIREILESLQSIIREFSTLNIPENRDGINSFYFDKILTEIIEQSFPVSKNPNNSEEINGIIKKLLVDLYSKEFRADTPTDYKEIIGRSIKTMINDTQVKSSKAGIVKADEWMEGIKRKLTIINEALTNSNNADNEKILPAVRELHTAVQFFNDITCFEVFAQIPLVLKDNSTEGELYIMKRKGGKGKINAKDFSLFLSLSTIHMGVIDIFVHVRNKNVMLKVAAVGEEYKQLIMNEYKSLYEALQQKGYRLLELNYILQDEKINLFNAEKKEAELTHNKKRKIDVKV